MGDLLDSVRRQLRERIEELRPFVEEYERLEAAGNVLEAIGVTRGRNGDEALSREPLPPVRSSRDAHRAGPRSRRVDGSRRPGDGRGPGRR